jgi:rhodanese-related sulfurtransferase
MNSSRAPASVGSTRPSSMTVATSIKPADADRSPQERNLRWQIIRDVGGVVLLAIVALAVGLAINHFSAAALPIVYRTPEQRFDAELTTMVSAPPFKIAPAATVRLEEFHSAVESKSALIFDARPSVFFDNGHVPGALNLARDDFARDYRKMAGVLQSAHDKPIIVYCSGGDCHDSRMVANALLSLGFTNVRVFTGGWEEWSAAGLPVSKGSGS